MLRKVLLQTHSRYCLQKCFSSNIAKEAKICQYYHLKEALQKGVTLIDVREPSELKEIGKIPKSVNVPLGEIEKAFKMNESTFLKKYGFSKPSITSEIVLTCRSGKRAMDAYEKLKALGYNEVLVYQGSFQDWLQKGESVEK